MAAPWWQVHRQQDVEFIRVLQAFRVGDFRPEYIAWIERHCSSIANLPPGAPVTWLAPLKDVRVFL